MRLNIYKGLLVLTVLGLFFMAAPEVLANSPDVEGYVRTQGTNAPIAGVWVRWKDSYNDTRYVQTDSNGHYLFPSWQSMSDADRLDQYDTMIDTNLDSINDSRMVYANGDLPVSQFLGFGCGNNPQIFTVILPESWDGSFSNQVLDTTNSLTLMQVADITYTPTNPLPSSPPGSCQTGLVGDYYNSTDLSGSIALTRVDPAIAFEWTSSDPFSADFSVRWRGYIVAPETGDYTFSLLSNDGSNLWIDNNLVIDNWIYVGAVEKYSSPIHLVAGQSYPIEVGFYDLGGMARTWLFWSSNTRPKSIVGGNNIYTDNSCISLASPTPIGTPLPTPSPTPPISIGDVTPPSKPIIINPPPICVVPDNQQVNPRASALWGNPREIQVKTADPESGIASVTMNITNSPQATTNIVNKNFTLNGPSTPPDIYDFAVYSQSPADLGTGTVIIPDNQFTISVHSTNGAGVDSPETKYSFNADSNCQCPVLDAFGGDVHSNGSITLGCEP